MEKTFAADLLRAMKDGHQKLISMAPTKPFEALLGVSFSSYRRSDVLGLFLYIYIYIYMYIYTTFSCQSQSWAPVAYFS